MIRRDAAGIVAAAAVAELLSEALFRSGLGDFLKGKPRAKSDARRCRPVGSNRQFYASDFLGAAKKIDLVPFFERHVGLFPHWTTADVSADTAHLAKITGHAHLHHFDLEKGFHSPLHFNLVSVGTNFE